MLIFKNDVELNWMSRKVAACSVFISNIFGDDHTF